MNLFPFYLFERGRMFEPEPEPELFLDLFDKIQEADLTTKDNELYKQIHSATIKLSTYFEKSVEKFPSLFEANLKRFDECLTYLEKIAVPNKCVCAGVVDAIPGFRCADCSKFENTIYCYDCFQNSQDLHKGHKLYYLFYSIGMCDCGDPLALNTYCHEHSGPFTEQSQIDNYVQKSFGNKVVENLTKFLDEFFLEYSKYFILTEKCELFMEEPFKEKFSGKKGDEIIKEKKDVILLKSNFCIVFQNFIYFLRLISKNNSGMVQLITNYFIKINFESVKLEDEYLTNHICIETNKNEIIFDKDKKENHVCKCPFLRLFLSNYRDDVKLNSKEDEQQFIFSFAQNLQLRKIFSVLYFFLYNQNLYNNNENAIYCRTQFYLADTLELITRKTSFLEDSVDAVYNYVKILMKKNDDEKQINEKVLKKINSIILETSGDMKYYSKQKMGKMITEKTTYFKKAIDIICLFQNMNEFESIVPHPRFQGKFFIHYYYEIERFLTRIPQLLNCCLEYEKIDKLKEIYKYIINKILNQENEGIKQLKENEFSFHLVLYRCFGIFMNTFCINYSITNNCTLLDAVYFFKKTFFESQEQVEKLVDVVLKDYYKFFGFLCGCKNSYFNYYEKASLNFIIYTDFTFYKNDVTLLKYIFVLTDRKIDINSFLKLSNIENVYSKFNNIFNLGLIEKEKPIPEKIEKKQEETNDNNNRNHENMTDEDRREMILNLILNRNLDLKKTESQDEFSIIMQWKMLLELLIFIIKDDYCCYWSHINIYEEILSTKAKTDLFNTIKNNKFVMNDLKNLLEKIIILSVIKNGNLIDTQKLEKNIDQFFLNLFEDNNVYNKILEELTYNKMNGETKMFFLKDEYLKLIDCNDYINQKDKSEIQKYILEFKKDVVKTYNYHFYNPSELTFDFFSKVYEKVFLCKENLELIIKICDKLINIDKISEYLDKKSVRNSLLPLMLNYLQIFNVINTKSFIEFKLENKNSINKLYELLNDFVKNNQNNMTIDKDLEEQIKQILNQMNRYQLIFDTFQGDLSKLKKYDYNIDIIEQIRNSIKSNQNNINIIPVEKENKDEKKQKSKLAKDKLKILMKKKTNDFMKKIESNQEMVKAIDEHINDEENMKIKGEEIMCFYCRNSIKLNSFEQPYGKLGLCTKNLFYINSIKATLRDELIKLGLGDDNKLFSEINKKIYLQGFSRIISCGHYFHNSCFFDGCNKDFNKLFSCPLCLKNQNILIPPLTLFHDKYSFLKSENIKELFKEKKEEEMKIETENNKGIDLFNTTVITYLMSINIFKNDIEKYNSFLDDMYPYYKAHLNYFENIFYVDGTTFHKHQQIDNIKNLILSLRLLVHDSKDCNKFEIVKYIKENLIELAKGPDENKYIFQHPDSYMHYLNLYEKVTLSLLLLFDYEEIKETFKYILYIFLPYFCFGLYFKKLLIVNGKNKLNPEKIIEKIDSNEFKKYINDENKEILKYLNQFLKKFCFIKIISDYQNKNEELINSFNELTIENILSLIDMNDLLKLLPKNDIKICDIINNLSKTFNTNETFYKIFPSDLNFDKVIDSIINNIKKYKDAISCELTHELIIQFTPIKFNFVPMENNIFDFLLKNIAKKCEVCQRIKKDSLLCLNCGGKLCQLIQDRQRNDEALIHIDNCTGDNCIYIDMNNMKLYYVNKFGRELKLYPLYVDQNGSGPKKFLHISNEFNLSHEKLKLTLKNYVTKDFNFK